MLFKKAVGGNRLILLLVVLLGSLISVFSAHAIDICYDSSNPLYCAPTTEELCQGNVHDDQSYEQADQCTLGCCCNAYLPDYTFEGLCPTESEFYVVSNPDPSSINCEAICFNQANPGLTGVITGEGTPLEDATVSLVNGGNTVSEADGSYNIEDVIPGVYTLRVVPPIESGCQEKTVEQVAITGYGQTLDVDLTCDCISQWNCEEWVCGDDNVETRTCIDEHACPVPTNKPEFIRVCSYFDEAFCSDPAALNNGEECYYDPNNPENNQVGSCGSIENCVPVNDPNQQGCYCRNNFEYCGDGQCNAAIGECNSCAGTGQDCRYPNDQLNEVCSGDCSTETPEIIEATSMPGDVSLTILWNDHNPFCVDSYIIERCEGTDSDCQQFQERGNGIVSFEDTGLQPETTYCYTVTFDYADPLLSPQTSDQVCFTTGDLACIFEYYEDTFCYNNSVSECNDETLLIQQRTPCDEQTCIFDGTAAECYEQTPCEVCNGIYGIFADPSLEIDNYECRSYYEEYLGACYFDQTPTTVEAYGACSLVSSCYDYASQDACEADTCNLFSFPPHEGCTWEVYAEELGIGVCKPTNTTFEDCTLCEEHPLLDICTQGLCSAYGSCYYNPSTTFTGSLETLGCVGITDMACSFYDNEQDCIGDRAVSVDVQWDADYLKRVAGTNTKIPSDDLLGLGACTWTGEACIKDANNFVDIEGRDDCYEPPFDREDIARCLADNEPPVTTVSLDGNSDEEITFGVGDYFDVVYSVSDNVYSSEDIETYFCIPYEEISYDRVVFRNALSTDVVPCYPNRSIDALKNNLLYQDIEEDEYETQLVYYSVDLAKNLEVVTQKDIIIDAKAPEIYNFDVNVEPLFVSEDSYLSNMELQFATSEEAFCNASLVSLGTGQTITGGIYAYDDRFRTAYNRLQPSSYVFYIDCHDKYGNYAETFQEIIPADGDPSIQNPQPNETVATTDVTLSIETGGATACKYSEYPPFDYASMSANNYFDQSTADSNLFTKTVSLDVGAYRFYTACVFPDGSVTEYNLADAIVFAVDTQSPRTDLVDADTGHHFLGENHTEEIRLAAECYDPAITLGNVHMEFGCDQTTYCVSRNSLNCNLWRPFTGIVELSYEDADPETHLAWIYFNSTDKGGNAETVQKTGIPLKDMRKPSVQIRID